MRRKPYSWSSRFRGGDGFIMKGKKEVVETLFNFVDQLKAGRAVGNLPSTVKFLRFPWKPFLVVF